MRITVDIHNHLYPEDWMNLLEKSTGRITMKRTGPSSMIFFADGIPVAHVKRAGHFNPSARLEDMEKHGIDVHILSLSTPSVEVLASKDGVFWAQKVNEYFATLQQKYSKRFYVYATLPFQDIDQSLKELDRAYKDLGVKGVMMFSNINGKSIASPEFHPIFAKAAEYDLPVMIHPSHPPGAEMMKSLKLPPMVLGFVYDTTMAFVSLIYQGVLEKYPKLKLIHTHLGAVVPYMVKRLDDLYKSYSEEYHLELARPPMYYYKNQVYVDSISYHLPAVRCCLDWLGVDHIMLGTDYAHPVGHIEEAVKSIEDIGLSRKDTEKILGGNAVQIFNLPS